MDIFPKGLAHGFGPNMAIFTTFFLYSRLKNAFLDYNNKLTQGLVKIWSFFQPFFKGNIGQENDLYHILERKNAFLGYKNLKFKKSKN